MKVPNFGRALQPMLYLRAAPFGAVRSSPACMRRGRLLAWLGVLAFLLGGQLSAQLPPDLLKPFRRGQHVEAVVDTTLYFRDQAHAPIRMGDVFEVLAYQEQTERLYVSGKDVSGQTVALYAPARCFTLEPDSTKPMTAILPVSLSPSLQPAPLPAPAAAPVPAAAPSLPPAPSLPSAPEALLAPSVPAALVDVSTTFDPQVREVTAKVAQSFAFVEGKTGAGSAFMCSYHGKKVLFTNQHVVRENPELKFTRVDGAHLLLGTATAAVDHDILSFETTDATPALELEQDFSANVAIGDDVVVMGNTEGAGVVKPLLGKVAGFGPNLVEVTSEFMPGNSGSPIVHLKTGHVIGIATYAVIRNSNSLTGDPMAPTVRRFGYRIDSVNKWQPVEWREYEAEAEATTKVREFTNSLLSLLRDLRQPVFDLGKRRDPRLKEAISFLAPLTSPSRHVREDLEKAVDNFIGQLKNLTVRDVESLRPKLKYDFFQRELAAEGSFRYQLSDAMGETLKRRR